MTWIAEAVSDSFSECLETDITSTSMSSLRLNFFRIASGRMREFVSPRALLVKASATSKNNGFEIRRFWSFQCFMKIRFKLCSGHRAQNVLKEAILVPVLVGDALSKNRRGPRLHSSVKFCAGSKDWLSGPFPTRPYVFSHVADCGSRADVVIERICIGRMKKLVT